MAKKHFDQYFTPLHEVRNIVNALEIELNLSSSEHTLYDPFAGHGNFLRVFKEKGYKFYGTEIDIDLPVFENTTYLDFRTIKTYPSEHTVVISNPPFGAMDWIFPKLMSDLSNNANLDAVVLLLRTTICESDARASFFAKYPPTKVVRCASRINWVDEFDNRLMFPDANGKMKPSTDSIGCDILIYHKNDIRAYGDTSYCLAWPNREGVDFKLKKIKP